MAFGKLVWRWFSRFACVGPPAIRWAIDRMPAKTPWTSIASLPPYGLKTPLAALASDAHRSRERDGQVIARDIETVASAMGRRVGRELARARLRAPR